MVYTGYITFYGICFDSRENLEIFLNHLLGIRPNVEKLIMLAHKFEKGNIWEKVPKDIVKLIFSLVSKEEKNDISTFLENKNEENEENEENGGFEDMCEIYENLLSKHGYDLKIETKKCCHDDGSYFLGFNLGNTDFVYRDEVREYENFDEYHYHNFNQLLEIRKRYMDNKKKMKATFDRIENKIKSNIRSTVQNEEDRDDIFDGLNFNLRYFTFANDCDSCS